MDLTLERPIASNSAANFRDVRELKRALNRLGYYTPAKDIGLVDFTDDDLFAAIERFQRDLGLPATRAIKPEDVTERAINTAIEDQPLAEPYIWRSCQDDKTRSSHAARDGKVFNWIQPPEGGHPGEDFNCRCWAEPFMGKKTVDQIYDPPINRMPDLDVAVISMFFGKTVIGQTWKLWLRANKRDPEWQLGTHKKPQKWASQIEKRKWTPEQIAQAIKYGKKYQAPNKVNPGNTATRYEYNSKFVVRDDKTKQILQISAEEKFDPNEIGTP